VRKIALILGGGPGGGSYAAGAVVELLTALERVQAADPPTLDVIVASSAAALPAAIAARALVVNPGLVPWIERTWVDALDAGVLLDPGRSDRDGLLASGPLHELAHTLIAGDPAADDRPSARFGGSLQVAFPLTPVRPSGAPVRSALFELGTAPGTRCGRAWPRPLWPHRPHPASCQPCGSRDGTGPSWPVTARPAATPRQRSPEP
jgi:hypothetical protein